MKWLAGLLLCFVAFSAAAEPVTPSAYHPAPSRHQAKPMTLKLPPHARVVIIPINDAIELGLAAFIRRVMRTYSHADVIVLDMNTLGGRVDAAIQIRDALLSSKVPTLTLIRPRAISAGALIALATDVIAITPGSTFGAATPIRMDGSGQSQAVEEKMVSYMRTEMRATAEAKGRRGDLAEAMVDKEVEIKGIVPSGKLLTLDTDRALESGMAELRTGGLRSALRALGATQPRIVRTRINWAESVARALTGPVLSGLLMSLGMLAILIALYTQHFGVPALLGITALGLFFFGHLVVHLAGWEEMILFVIGLGLLAVEVIALPGFGIVGVLGLLATLASLVLALVGLRLDVSIDLGALNDAIFRVFVSVGMAILGSALAFRVLPHSAAGRKLVLQTAILPGEALDLGVSPEIVGQTGIAFTDLRPAGKADVNGLRYDVISEQDFVARGEPVRVVRVAGNRVVVRKSAT
ncbi:MAG: nodulation protein NfeD [Myxococcales bacterium]|nr:nodulation protein NfeD [Myxococcales bacterium]